MTDPDAAPAARASRAPSWLPALSLRRDLALPLVLLAVQLTGAAVAGDATGKMVVVISSTVNPTDVNTKFRDVAVPVVTWESQIFDDMRLTSTSTSNFGTQTAQTYVMRGQLSAAQQVALAEGRFDAGVFPSVQPQVDPPVATTAVMTASAAEAAAVNQEAPKKKRGFWSKLFGKGQPADEDKK